MKRKNNLKEIRKLGSCEDLEPLRLGNQNLETVIGLFKDDLIYQVTQRLPNQMVDFSEDLKRGHGKGISVLLEDIARKIQLHDWFVSLAEDDCDDEECSCRRNT
jgi:hypothetical protein